MKKSSWYFRHKMWKFYRIKSYVVFMFYIECKSSRDYNIRLRLNYINQISITWFMLFCLSQFFLQQCVLFFVLTKWNYSHLAFLGLEGKRRQFLIRDQRHAFCKRHKKTKFNRILSLTLNAKYLLSTNAYLSMTGSCINS